FIAALTPSARPAMTMVPARSDAIVSRHGEAEHFTGDVWLDDLLTQKGSSGANVYRVCFAPGARTHWHSHPAGQLLFVISGLGRVGDKQQGRIVGPGDVIYAAPNEPHWHGAGPNSPMVHLAFSLVAPGKDGGKAAWDAPVTDEEYARRFGGH